MTELQNNSAATQSGLADSAVVAQRIVVRDFVCTATIGVTEEERTRPQRLGICMELALIAKPPMSDDIGEVLSYGRVVALLRSICFETRFQLLETLAEALADSFFGFPQVTATKLRIEKLERYPDIAGVGIEIERRRDREASK